MTTHKKIITIVVIFALVSIVTFSYPSQLSLAKTSQDKTKTDSHTSSSQRKSSIDNTSSDIDQMKFQQFGTCLGIAAGKNSFATEKEVQNCFLIVYGSAPSLSDVSSSSTANKQPKK